MDWKDGLTAAVIVGLGYLGIKRVTNGADPLSAECPMRDVIRDRWGELDYECGSQDVKVRDIPIPPHSQLCCAKCSDSLWDEAGAMGDAIAEQMYEDNYYGHEHPDGDYMERMGISEDYVIQPFDAETNFEATQWWNRQTPTGHEKANDEHGGFYIQTDYDIGTIKEIFKDWKPKAHPYEKRITQDSFDNWCEDCGEIHDKEKFVHYQFYLPQSNSRRSRMRYVSGNYCSNDADCGANICESCYDGGAECEECSAVICSTCKGESEYTTGDILCQECLPEEYQAESFSADMTSPAGKSAFQPARCPICFAHKPLYQDMKKMSGKSGGWPYYLFCKKCISKKDYRAESFSAEERKEKQCDRCNPEKYRIGHRPRLTDEDKKDMIEVQYFCPVGMHNWTEWELKKWDYNADAEYTGNNPCRQGCTHACAECCGCGAESFGPPMKNFLGKHKAIKAGKNFVKNFLTQSNFCAGLKVTIGT